MHVSIKQYDCYDDHSEKTFDKKLKTNAEELVKGVGNKQGTKRIIEVHKHLNFFLK